MNKPWQFSIPSEKRQSESEARGTVGRGTRVESLRCCWLQVVLVVAVAVAAAASGASAASAGAVCCVRFAVCGLRFADCRLLLLLLLAAV